MSKKRKLVSGEPTPLDLFDPVNFVHFLSPEAPDELGALPFAPFDNRRLTLPTTDEIDLYRRLAEEMKVDPFDDRYAALIALHRLRPPV